MRPQESSLFLQGDQLSVAEVLFVPPRVRPRTFFLISPSFLLSFIFIALCRNAQVFVSCLSLRELYVRFGELKMA